MAVKYWVSKAPGGWSGSRGAGTESSPYDGALGCAAAHGTGILPGDTVIFMGEYGPVLQAEIEADWPNSNAITAPLTKQANHTTGQGGIIFGDRYDQSSTARDITYIFRGDGWHIDGRGATTNAGRMRASLIIQGVRNVVDGLRIVSGNWNYIDTGRIAGTGTVGVGVANYVPEVSWENFGLIMWGGWGCQVRNTTAWGGNAFGRTGIEVRLGKGVSDANEAGDVIIEDCVAYGGFYLIAVRHDSLIGSGTVAPTDYIPAASANMYVRRNVMYDARWGDTLTTPLINHAMRHGGMLDCQGSLWYKGNAWVYDNEFYGTCQDVAQCVGANYEFFDNYVHDINLAFPASETILYYYNNSGTWATTTTTAIGTGVKLGLNPYDGNISKTVWPDLGTIDTSTYAIPAFRNRVYRNRFVNQYGSAGCISGNGSSGMIVVANECIATSPIQLGGSDATYTRAHWVANNYVNSRSGAGFQLGANAAVWAYNNILDGATTDIITPYATSVFHGGNNRLVNGTSNFNGSTNNMVGNTTGAADYVEGVGPTAAGNCAAAGSWQGIYGARAQCAFRDKNGLPWLKDKLAIGPYRD